MAANAQINEPVAIHMNTVDIITANIEPHIAAVEIKLERACGGRACAGGNETDEIVLSNSASTWAAGESSQVEVRAVDGEDHRAVSHHTERGDVRA